MQHDSHKEQTRRPWRNGLVVAAALAIAVFIPLSCDTTEAPPPAAEGRGAIIEYEVLYNRTASAINEQLESLGVPVRARHNVRVYRLIYKTIGATGEWTQASGAVAVPDPAFGALEVVAYQHGTITMDSEAPSRSEFSQFIGVVYASDGYLAIMPDLLGLGSSPGMHPYHHAETAISAVVDMLRAARHLAAQEDIQLSEKLFLTGYSQGGYTAMAVHRGIEANHADEFTVTASAPGAGAYDMSGIMSDEMLSTDPHPAPYYLAYLIEGYNTVYQMFDDPSEYFASPYDVRIPPLFDGTHSANAIDAQLPQVARDMLNPELLADYESDPNHFFRTILAENNMHQWAPKAPIRMFHCSGDDHVPVENSHAALEGLTGSVELVEPVRGGDHFECALPSLFGAKAWIDTF